MQAVYIQSSCKSIQWPCNYHSNMCITYIYKTQLYYLKTLDKLSKWFIVHQEYLHPVVTWQQGYRNYKQSNFECVMCQEMLMSLADVNVTSRRCVATCLFHALIIVQPIYRRCKYLSNLIFCVFILCHFIIQFTHCHMACILG